MTGKRLLAWGGLLLSGALVWLTVRNVDFARTADALREASYWTLAPALLALVLGVALRAARWQVLFESETRPPLGPVTGAMLVGYLFNAILPARAGEAARVIALSRRCGNSRAEVLATVVAERVLDVLSLLILLFVASPFLPEVSWLGKAAALAAVFAACIVVVVVVLARHQERPLVWALRPLARWIPAERADQAAANLVRGLAAFRRPGVAARGLALTTVSWVALAFSAWALLAGFDLDVGFTGALLVVIATSLALILPSAPASVGPFEAGTVVALSAYGIDQSDALSYALVYHALNLLPFLLVGYVALNRHVVGVRRRVV